MNKNTVWIGIVVVVLLALALWWLSMGTNDTVSGDTTGDVAGVQDSGADGSKDGGVDTSIEVTAGADVTTATVRYTATGFSPSTLTIKKGTRVVFVNESGGEMWVGSDEHPTHTNYAGTTKDEHCVGGAPSQTAFDQCGRTNSYAVTFTKVGTWDYHNHVQSDDRGTIIVTD